MPRNIDRPERDERDVLRREQRSTRLRVADPVEPSVESEPVAVPNPHPGRDSRGRFRRRVLQVQRSSKVRAGQD